MNQDKQTHKASGGEPLTTEGLDALLSERGLRFDGKPEQEGGLLHRQDGTVGGYLRPPNSRDKGLTTTDIFPLHDAVVDNAESLAVTDCLTGGELELIGYDVSEHDTAPIMAEDSPVRHDLENNTDELARKLFGSSYYGGLKCTTELTEFDVEIAFKPHADRQLMALHVVRNLKLLSKILENHDLQLLPVSTLPHRELVDEDISKDFYIQHMTDDMLGRENTRKFTCVSAQGHAEMLDGDAALFALNQLQHISPLLYGLTMAAPFTHGEATGHSGRYELRKKYSPSGGIFIDPQPETVTEYYKLADEQLRRGETPSAVRVAGQHRDRARFDISPHGTIENCESDTAGGSPVRLLAVQHLKDVIVWKLQHLHITGRTDELKNWPALFPDTTTRESLAIADANSIEIGKKGLIARLAGQDGQLRSGRELLLQAIKFANEPLIEKGEKVLWPGMPNGVTEHLYKASLAPTPELFSMYRRGGAVEIAGFYKTHIGNISHWIQRRHADLVADGMDYQEAIVNCSDNIAERYGPYLGRLSTNEVTGIFKA